MIRRRIWGSGAVKGVSFLSPWRGRHPHARRPMLSTKERAVKLGGPHRPFDLPTEGGIFHRKATQGSGLLTRPPGRAVGGGRLMPATPPISSNEFASDSNQPFASGTATRRDDPPLRTRINTLFLLSVCAALIASRTSPALATLLPATSRITSPSLPAPATVLAGASVRPSRGTSVPRVAPPLSLLSVSALASSEFGNWPSVRLMTLSSPL